MCDHLLPYHLINIKLKSQDRSECPQRQRHKRLLSDILKFLTKDCQSYQSTQTAALDHQ